MHIYQTNTMKVKKVGEKFVIAQQGKIVAEYDTLEKALEAAGFLEKEEAVNETQA